MAPHGGALVLELGRQAQGIIGSVHYFFLPGSYPQRDSWL